MEESFLLVRFDSSGAKILADKDSSVAREVASVAKVYLAAEVIRLLETGEINNQQVLIKKEDLDFYGTDVLADLVGENNSISLDVLTLVGLMVKYSCNSSASILSRLFFSSRKMLEKTAKKVWGLKNLKLISEDGQYLNKFSLQDLLTLFRNIYYERRGDYWDFLREKLRTSRNIYYLFDQKELEILGCKSGTKKDGSFYFINDCGVFRYNGKTFFMGAMVSNKSISQAVLRIRDIGAELLLVAKDNS
ncbi:MAG: hypothetical protein KatS3mg088_698 [Patescibacteria group bacterium]|nr:MAG: hypothetical protein KatS3mg088_698 [Patescibacteria group bacterium]